MPEFQENSTVLAVEQLADSLYRITLAAPHIAAHCQPGQFIMVACASCLDPLLRRPFSIHRRLGSDQIQILFRVIGRGTSLLSQLKPGQSLSLIGPLGQGFRVIADGPVCLIGGGIGIAPLLFLADHLQTAYRDCIVVLGSRTGSELLQVAQAFKKLGCQVKIATDDGTLGHHGLVTDLLDPLLSGMKQCYACGPHLMMARVAALCHDIPCQVSLEAHMACGLGACLGCTVHGADNRYRHVCKHGPVFNAKEIAWNR